MLEKDTRNDDVEIQGNKSANDKFPRIVMIIILTEFCERFSYSGMRAFLTLYLRSKLGYSDDEATEIYHIFSTLVYLFPIFGGMLADNYFGKFRTILYMMFVYAAGNLLVAVTAIPFLELPRRLWTLVGLLMITVGAGGIKPCVTAFGGDQFVLPAQERHLAVYFSVLYFTICTGSLIAKTVSPILRSEVTCFGDKDCYSLAFGAPGVVVIISVAVFVSAKSRYVMRQPEGNVVFNFVSCVFLGLKNLSLGRHSGSTPAHWLDSTEPRFSKSFILDVKRTLSILRLFTVLPVFWSLLDQLGSRWTLQATKMDGRFWFVTIKPDQMQVLVPAFIIIIITLTQKFIYPFLDKRNILRNPLDKLTLGGVLAGVAFIASGLLEIYLKTTYPVLPQLGHSQLRIFNGNPCNLTLTNKELNLNYLIPPLAHVSKKDLIVCGEKNVTFDVYGSCVIKKREAFLLEENTAVSFFVNGIHIRRFSDHVDKSKSGLPVVRFLVSSSLSGANITFYNELRKEMEATIDGGVGVSPQYEMFASTYSVRVNDHVVRREVNIESGGVYAIVLERTTQGYHSEFIVVTEANSISMALLLPQFLIMSCAEVLFAVTGNEFAFKESPDSMKAVMTAVWLFTTAVGNVIIILITRLFANYGQETQSFIYTGMMFCSIMVFYCMSRNYKTNITLEPEGVTRKCRSNSEVLYQQVKQTEECLDH